MAHDTTCHALTISGRNQRMLVYLGCLYTRTAVNVISLGPPQPPVVCPLPYLQWCSFQSSRNVWCFNCWEDQHPRSTPVHCVPDCWRPVRLSASPGRYCMSIVKLDSIDSSPQCFRGTIIIHRWSMCLPSFPLSLFCHHLSVCATFRWLVKPMFTLECMPLPLASRQVWGS